jgi:two-component system, chemotaxis family, chemotaxis protein CheY
MNVLVVDDSEIMRDLIVKLLRITRTDLEQAFEAGNTRDALAIARNCPVALVFLDVNMPVWDGGDVLAALHGDPVTRHIPVVLVGTGTHKGRVHAVPDGVRAFITVPFGLAEFECTVNTAMEHV